MSDHNIVDWNLINHKCVTKRCMISCPSDPNKIISFIIHNYNFDYTGIIIDIDDNDGGHRIIKCDADKIEITIYSDEININTSSKSVHDELIIDQIKDILNSFNEHVIHDILKKYLIDNLLYDLQTDECTVTRASFINEKLNGVTMIFDSGEVYVYGEGLIELYYYELNRVSKHTPDNYKNEVLNFINDYKEHVEKCKLYSPSLKLYLPSVII